MNNPAFSVARSLRRKLLLPLLLIGAAFAAATVWSIYAQSQKRLAERLRQRTELIANLVNYAAENVSRSGELQNIVTAIGAEEGVNLIVVVGGHPARVLAATRNAWFGQALTELPVKEVAEDLKEAIQTRQSRHHLHLETDQFDFTSPILLSRPELADQSLTDGAVMVHLDPRATQAAIWQLTLQFSIAFITALLLFAALGYGLIHHFVLRPIYRIGKLVEHHRAGAGESWAETDTHDELGALARTLHDSLTRTDAALHELEDQKNALRASEIQYRTLVENIPQNIFIKDRNSRWVSVNENFARGLGRRPEEVVGKRDSDFFPKELAEKYRADDQRIMQAGRMEELEEKHLQDGREIWVRTIKTPVRNEQGEISGVFCIFWDITEHKRMEKVQSCLSQLAYRLSLLSDAPSAARLVADAALDLLGWDACFLRLRSPDLARVLYMFNMDTMEGRRVEVPIPALPEPPGPVEERVMRDGAQIILRSAEFDGPPGLITFGDTGRRSASLLFVPLRHHGQHLGLFSIQSYREGAYDRAALDLLQTLADHASGALERIRAEQELESVHKQLLEASRRGGMAEIATNVLHNVGNVLNSVNISTTLIVQSVKQSRASSLARVVSLLQEHAHDLGEFITNDSRGKHVPAHLAQLSEHLLAEQETNVRELALLRQNIEHIKEIVAMQQNYATFGGVKEIINVVNLVEDSLRINEGALSRHRVEVIREFEPVPPLNVEKHKILQILVNLLRNAKYACQDSERADKRLTVRVAHGEGRIRISVIDNGVGIPLDNLTRIFNHGFTTRKDGHGFGLHSGALAAKEMGGSLTVHSDGPGQGAAFTLELPCPTRENSDE
jgi:PAS domain S-box-containing protein